MLNTQSTPAVIQSNVHSWVKPNWAWLAHMHSLETCNEETETPRGGLRLAPRQASHQGAWSSSLLHPYLLLTMDGLWAWLCLSISNVADRMSGAIPQRE